MTTIDHRASDDNKKALDTAFGGRIADLMGKAVNASAALVTADDRYLRKPHAVDGIQQPPRLRHQR